MDRDGWIEMDGWFRGLDLLDMMDFLFIGYFHLIGIAKFIYLILASVVYYFCIDPNTQNLRIRNLRSPRFLIWLRRLYVCTYCTAKGTWIVFYARIQAENQSESRILSSRNSSLISKSSLVSPWPAFPSSFSSVGCPLSILQFLVCFKVKN